MIQLDANVWRMDKTDLNLVKAMEGIEPRFHTVINLQTGFREILFNKDCNFELRWALGAGKRFVDFQLSGLIPPREVDIRTIVRLLGRADGPIVFHCRASRERTGFIAAAYRIGVQDWPFEKAYQEWRDSGCRWVTWRLWKGALWRWAYLYGSGTKK